MKLSFIFIPFLKLKFAFCAKNNWESCTYSNECASNCCANDDQNDQLLRCLPKSFLADCPREELLELGLAPL